MRRYEAVELQQRTPVACFGGTFQRLTLQYHHAISQPVDLPTTPDPVLIYITVCGNLKSNHTEHRIVHNVPHMATIGHAFRPSRPAHRRS